MPILFALAGATGIGKSELSLRLAERYDAEIIGVDSRQVYRGFAIGTAQPSAADMARVEHHQVNFLDPEKLADVLGLPEDEEVLMVMDLGYAAEGAGPLPNHENRKRLTETVSYM